MCKQYTRIYECGHRSYHRESTCNKKKLALSRPACRGESYLCLRMTGKCNACLSEQASEEIDFNVEALKIGIISLPFLDEIPDNMCQPQDAEDWGMLQKARVAKVIPVRLKEQLRLDLPKAKNWQSRRRCKRTSSLLRTEVMHHNIVGTYRHARSVFHA